MESSPTWSTANRAMLDRSLRALSRGTVQLPRLTFTERSELLDRCAEGVFRCAREWVAQACRAKRIALHGSIAAEEILAGPVCVLRYLRLLSRVLKEIQRAGAPSLPGSVKVNFQRRICVPVLPVPWLFDRLVFLGLTAEVWLQPDAASELRFVYQSLTEMKGSSKICGVLGAGNVSAIPATDMLTKIFQEGEVVLLKLNPVNEYLESVFSSAFEPLIAANLLRIVCGDGLVGQELVNHPLVDSLHLTGSHHTHSAIVWGTDGDERQQRPELRPPLVRKPVTSELGNVTPWIVVPGRYTSRQLDSQAEQMVASIVNNASFNCLATKVIVTSARWGQREEFLELLQSKLDGVPPRYAYYPGARERYERVSGRIVPEQDDGYLPWTLIRDADPLNSPHLFQDESFVCVCAETSLDNSNPADFLQAAVDLCNNHLFGTLCVNITAPPGFEKVDAIALERALATLRYGTVSINQWVGVAYGLMTPPWGGFPGATLEAPQSGVGQVHNAFGIQGIDKTVLRGPLCSRLKPVWFATHGTADRTAWALLDLYEHPTWQRLPKLMFQAVRG